MAYVSRLVDSELRSEMAALGAVLITGPKGCGKTETARQIARSELRIDVDPDVSELMGIDPFALLEGEKPRLIDEWQLQPKLWDYIRRSVDDSKQRGEFVLTGSAQPVDDVRFHSGVGRFSVLQMRPMSLQELGISTAAVRLADIFKNDLPATSKSDLELNDLIVTILRGGWPTNIGSDDDSAIRYIRSYVNLLEQTDVGRAMDKRVEPLKVKRLLQSYARNIATDASLTTVTADTQGEFEALAPNTVSRYIEALESLMIIENLPAFKPHIRSSATLRKASKKHFVDPSLAAAALELELDDLRSDLNYLGFLFESLVVRDLRVYAQSLGGRTYHYRDSTGLETDVIVQLPGGAWSAFEVKLGRVKHDEAAKALLKLAKNIDSSKMKPPASLNIITGFGFAYTRPDGVNVIPIACLGV